MFKQGLKSKIFGEVSLSVLAVAVCAVLVGGADAGVTAPESLSTAMERLKTAAHAKKIQRCNSQFFLFRKFTNACTRALDSLQDPVAQARKEALAEEAHLRETACGFLDYGCTPAQILTRNAADHLEEAADRLRLAVELELTDYKNDAAWDRILVKDNRLGVRFATDFIDRALEEYAKAYLATPPALGDDSDDDSGL